MSKSKRSDAAARLGRLGGLARRKWGKERRIEAARAAAVARWEKEKSG